MNLASDVISIKGIGDSLAKKLRLLGVKTAADLITYFPRRYEDYSKISDISRLRPGVVTIRAKITKLNSRYVRRGLHITEAWAEDNTAAVKITWFNQPYRAEAIKASAWYFLSGDYGLNRQQLTITNPSCELESSFPINTARIIPIYRETKGLKSYQIRQAIKQLMPLVGALPETLPAPIIQINRLIPLAQAIETIHFPASDAELVKAQKRLGFDEVFSLSLASLLNKYDFQKQAANIIKFMPAVAREYVSHLPFKLTDSQRRATWQIYLDMQKNQPMNRLLEGDVGSGKTVVAAMSALMVLSNGQQAALMAPTELLAQQHFKTVSQQFKYLGLDQQVALLISGQPAKQKNALQQQLKAKLPMLIIGTHALITDKFKIPNLGLIIVDEQHRFGVDQRKSLQAKANRLPHVLHLSATPIPRSLALTLFGELDISVLAAKPSGRKPIITSIKSPNSRTQLYAKIKTELAKGRQMFVVCPTIAESSMLTAKSAEETYKQLASKSFKTFKIGLLHGRLSSTQKTKIMQDFVAGSLDILVATTMVEVGVDVPNATIMVIESAERFGLAQIHQLRGRVGRSTHQGYCYLMLSDSLAPNKRLRVLEQSQDGFQLAEYDLEIRGPGAIYGQLQHGVLDLKIAKLTNFQLIQSARKSAQQFIDDRYDLLQYPQLAEKVTRLRAVTNLN